MCHKILRSPNLLRAIFASASEALALIATDGVVLEANAMLARIYDSTPMQLVGRPWHDPGGHVATMIGATSEDGQTRSERVYTVLSTGVLRILDVTATALPGTGSRQVMLRISDRTEQARIHELALRPEPLTASGWLAAVLGHELNTPLQTIQNYLYLLVESASDADYEEAVSHILAEVDRVREIMHRLLACQHTGSGDRLPASGSAALPGRKSEAD